MNNFEKPQINDKVELEKEVLDNLINKIGLPENSTFSDVYSLFFDEDQKIMNSKGSLDYLNPENKISQIKNLLTTYENSASVSINENIKNLLWLYYHHASQFEFQKGNKQKAIEDIEKALQFGDLQKNQITKLLELLFKDKITEAEKYISTITSYEKDTAELLLTEFKIKYAK